MTTSPYFSTQQQHRRVQGEFGQYSSGKKSLQTTLDGNVVVPRGEKINHDLREHEREQLWTNFNGHAQEALCWCCRNQTIRRTGAEFHTGHIVAEGRGGVRDLFNRVPICAGCNMGRGGQGQKNMFDWMIQNRQQHLYGLSQAVYDNYRRCCPFDTQYKCVWQFVLYQFGQHTFPRGGIVHADKIQDWLRQGEVYEIQQSIEKKKREFLDAQTAHNQEVAELMMKCNFIMRG